MKYAKWDAKKEGTTYLRWATDLTRDEESVLLGVSFIRTSTASGRCRREFA